MNTENKTLLNLGVKFTDNPTEYRRRYNTKIECECGGFVKKFTYHNHLKTNKHKLLLQLIELKSNIK